MDVTIKSENITLSKNKRYMTQNLCCPKCDKKLTSILPSELSKNLFSNLSTKECPKDSTTHSTDTQWPLVQTLGDTQSPCLTNL
jgi:hypothetical protein